MKTMILAAGLGTRLLPYTDHTPKPLFTISGQSLLDRTIRKLQKAGADAVMVNTHHLHQQIEAFLNEKSYAVPVHVRHEPEILGTGGAIKNVVDFWDQAPFLVINSDILFEIDLAEVYRFHLGHGYPVTMVLVDDPEFNQVWVNEAGHIDGFGTPQPKPQFSKNALTFTGIHVLNPEVLEWIPADQFVNIIDVYQKMLSHGHIIQAYVAPNAFWKDIGSLERYRGAVYDVMAAEAFHEGFDYIPPSPVVKTKLKGDGSNRSWYRLTHRHHSMILADHGISLTRGINEAGSFAAIGTHLKRKNIPVPQIFLHDTFAGLVFMEDLGDVNLQNFVASMNDERKTLPVYQKVIRALIQLSQSGIEGFNPSWCHQSEDYDQNLIIEKECRYFVDAFINGYLELDVDPASLIGEFSYLADRTIEYAFTGLMHRDLQSRNIMIKSDEPYFIDFQGARKGPVQYDLASLLLDPYVVLSPKIRDALLTYCTNRLSSFDAFDMQRFIKGYDYCSITRNLQILGAFGHLSKNMGKSYFEAFIPTAVSSLRVNLNRLRDGSRFPELQDVVSKAALELESLECAG